MKLVIATTLWPRAAHSLNSPPVVAFELISALARQPGLSVAVLKLTPHDAAPSDAADQEGAATLAQQGVVIEELRLPPSPPQRWFPWMAVAGRIQDFIPVVAHRDLANAAVRRMHADAVLPLWTEWGTALLADAPGFKFAYYGNVDPKNYRIQTAERRRLGQLSWLRWMLEKIAANVFERVHLAEMRKYQAHGNVAANDAAYYAENGVPDAFYIQNLWIDRIGDSWRAERARLENRNGCRIIGNVGKLGATANTLGMEILGRDLLPQLRRAMPMPWEMHILGGGKLRPDVAQLLDAPEVRLRGFVDNIDEEVLRANIFLGMNNAGPFKVGHTRYLHAWTLGACLVVHADAALSMPEIRHRDNALMGRDAAEIADLIAEAATDPALRLRLGEAGYQTYRCNFTGPVVARAIAQRLRGIVP